MLSSNQETSNCNLGLIETRPHIKDWRVDPPHCSGSVPNCHIYAVILGTRSLVLAHCFVWLLGSSRCIIFCIVWTCTSSDASSNMGIQYDLLEAPLHGIQCWSNYPKMGLIRFLLPFFHFSLDYLQKRPKHGWEASFYS